MISIDFLNISNAKTIGRLLPFWARGKKLAIFLLGVLSPLQKAHETFKSWAFEQYVKAHITAQKDSLEWYLKYCLHSHFADPEDVFYIVHGENRIKSCFSDLFWNNERVWDNTLTWQYEYELPININPNIACFTDGLWYNNRLWVSALLWNGVSAANNDDDTSDESTNDIKVYAPAIVVTINYSHEDYERDIRNIMSKYMINFNKIRIIISNLQL